MQGPLHASTALADLLGLEDCEKAELSGLEFLNRLVQLGHLSLPRSEPKMTPRERWQSLLKPAVQMGLIGQDPWSDMAVHDLRTEIVTRWDFDASTRAWTSSETLVKMERTPFARGAMRECFRMKKMSQVGGTHLSSATPSSATPSFPTPICTKTRDRPRYSACRRASSTAPVIPRQSPRLLFSMNTPPRTPPPPFRCRPAHR
jgi:hypothetical protein